MLGLVIGVTNEITKERWKSCALATMSGLKEPLRRKGVRMMLYIAIALLIFSGAFYWASKAVLRRSDRIHTASTYRNDFLNAAHGLVRDERVPHEVAHFAFFMAERLYSTNVLRAIVWQLLTNHHPSRIASDFFAKVQKMPPELQGLFVKAVVLFGISVTYNNLFLGYIFRRLFWVSVQNASRTTLEDNRVRVLTDDLAQQACAA